LQKLALRAQGLRQLVEILMARQQQAAVTERF